MINNVGRTKNAPWLFYPTKIDLLNDETRIPFYVSFDDDEVYEHQLQFKIAK